MYVCCINAHSEVVENKLPRLICYVTEAAVRWCLAPLAETERVEVDLTADAGMAKCGAAILLKCFKTCSLFTPFCCTDQNKAFWDCYRSKRVCHFMQLSLLLVYRRDESDNPLIGPCMDMPKDSGSIGNAKQSLSSAKVG